MLRENARLIAGFAICACSLTEPRYWHVSNRWSVLKLTVAKKRPQRMKQAISIRIDPKALERGRKAAKLENRTLTNFIETALKERLKTRPRRAK